MQIPTVIILTSYMRSYISQLYQSFIISIDTLKTANRTYLSFLKKSDTLVHCIMNTVHCTIYIAYFTRIIIAIVIICWQTAEQLYITIP